MTTDKTASDAKGPDGKRVLLLGATGTAGQATAKALLRAGHHVACVVRGSGRSLPQGAEIRVADVTNMTSLTQDGLRGERFDAIISCLASRSGAEHDAWALDHDAQVNALKLVKDAEIGQFILLSAICVQKPRLPFQEAKLAFEAKLTASGLTYSIVRPTAFFKSLSGQIARVKAGKPFLVFGDGALTRCKPISDDDLGEFIASCLVDTSKHNRILPIGGPGPALSPRDQAEILFDLLGQKPRIKQVPVAVMDTIIAGLSLLGKVHAKSAARAELARIGRYYATESMLVWDAEAGRYDADATPETGMDTLRDHYAAVLSSKAQVDLGDHAVF